MNRIAEARRGIESVLARWDGWLSYLEDQAADPLRGTPTDCGPITRHISDPTADTALRRLPISDMIRDAEATIIEIEATACAMLCSTGCAMRPAPTFPPALRLARSGHLVTQLANTRRADRPAGPWWDEHAAYLGGLARQLDAMVQHRGKADTTAEVQRARCGAQTDAGRTTEPWFRPDCSSLATSRWTGLCSACDRRRRRWETNNDRDVQ